MLRTLLLLMIIFPAIIFAQEFHVSPNGDDGASGTSSQPWESIQHAMDNATPGSTVYIHQGVYNERVYVNVSGTDGNYITFRASGDDEVILDGSGLTDYALMEIYDVHHVAIEGIKMMNNEQLDAVGILIEGACDHIRIEDCDISNINFSTDPSATINSSTNAQALIVYGSEADHAITDLEIIDNEIFDCRLGYSEALAVNGNVDGFVISENEVHHVSNIGIDIIGHEGTCSDPAFDQARNGLIFENETYNCLSPYATAAGIYVDGGKDLIIERNHVYNNQWGIEIGCENVGTTTDNVLVRNNFVYRNSTAGLHVGGYDYPDGSGKVTNTKIINNTFFGNDTENDWTGEMYLSYNENLEVRNNIFYADNGNGMMMSDENLAASNMGMVITANAWYHPLGNGSVEWAYGDNYYNSIEEFNAATGFAPWLIWVDPHFVNVGAEPDLHLTSDTDNDIINWGDFSEHFGEWDIDNEYRVAGGAVDIGADEYGSSVGIQELATRSLKIYPNPTKDFLNIADQNIESIVIFDINGRTIVQTSAFSGMVQIEVRDLKNGIYIIKGTDKKGWPFTSKFIKQ